MTRKRFIKLAMAEGMDRNEAKFAVECISKLYKSYQQAYDNLCGIIKGRFEFYMPGFEKRIIKKGKKYYK